MGSSLLVALILALVGGISVVIASRSGVHQGATRADSTPVDPRPTPVRPVAEPPPRNPRVPEPAVHSRVGALLRLGGLLVLLGTTTAVVVAVCLFAGVAALSRSL